MLHRASPAAQTRVPSALPLANHLSPFLARFTALRLSLYASGILLYVLSCLSHDHCTLLVTHSGQGRRPMSLLS